MERLLIILDRKAISATFPNEDGTYKAICFTTPNLKILMGMYPEVLQMDITFRLNIHGYNTIHIVCVDRFMKSHTLAFGMLSDRTEGAIQIFVDFFAEQMGDNLDKVEVVFWIKRPPSTCQSIMPCPMRGSFCAISILLRQRATICQKLRTVKMLWRPSALAYGRKLKKNLQFSVPNC